MTSSHLYMQSINAQGPIGVFDSGVGGISVLKHIHELMPNESMIYVADSLYAPYGQRSVEEIQQRTRKIAQFLCEQGAKCLVIACNTATAAAAQLLRTEFDLPIIGMEPAVKPAVAVTQTGVIGVLATSGTLKSAQFAALLEHYGQGVTVVTQAGVGLVELIEQGKFASAEMSELLTVYLTPILEANADTLVLGCTHYPFLRALLQQLIPSLQARLGLVTRPIILIDTGHAVATQAQRRLLEQNLLNPVQHMGCVHFWTSGALIPSRMIIEQLWGRASEVSTLLESG